MYERELPVLFATGYADGDGTALGLPAPGRDVVGKPFDMDDVERRIRALLAP